MSRFYVGQPVVCIYAPEQWQMSAIIVMMGLKPVFPIKDRKYWIRGYSVRLPDHVYINGVDRFVYEETGFAPITDELVRSMITVRERIDA